MLCRVSMTGPSVFGVAAPNIELAGMITLDNNLDGIAVRKKLFSEKTATWSVLPLHGSLAGLWCPWQTCGALDRPDKPVVPLTGPKCPC